MPEAEADRIYDHEVSSTIEIIVIVASSIYLLVNIALLCYMGVRFEASEDREQLLMNRTNSVVPTEEDGPIERSVSMTNRQKRELFLALSRLENRKITMIPEEKENDEEESYRGFERELSVSSDDDSSSDVESRVVDPPISYINFKNLRSRGRNLDFDSARVYDLTEDLIEAVFYDSIKLSSLVEEEEPPDIDLPPEISYPSPIHH